MSVLENFKNIPRSPYGGRQGSNVIFFSLNLQRSPWRKKRGDLSPTPRATGPCRPLGGRQGPFFFLQGLRCKFKEKKLHFRPVALWEGDRGIFLKYLKTDIYF